jgi:hypothetical protein
MPPPPVSAPRLRCDRCGRAIDVTADELLQFSRGKYPQCCRRPMILEVQAHSVRPSDNTDLERPALRL